MLKLYGSEAGGRDVGKGGRISEIINSSLSSKQGFLELYTQRLKVGNICSLLPHRLKLSRLKPSSLRSHRLRLYRPEVLLV